MINYLRIIKLLIENAYRVDCGIGDIEEFVTNGKPENCSPDNEILVVGYNRHIGTIVGEKQEGLALFVSEGFQRTIEEKGPSRNGITDYNIGILFDMIEEVDHLVLLAFRMCHHMPVSRLELELQANITKYLLSIYLIARQERTYPFARPVVREQISQMISHTRFQSDNPVEDARYNNAAILAGAFFDYLQGLPTIDRKSEIPRFYRLTHHQKLGRIRSFTGIGPYARK